MDSDILFRMRTVKVTPFRTLIEAIKDIMMETNIEFDSHGMRILTMDGTHTILVHLRLHAESFDEFFCPHKVILGINMHNLFKIVKTTSGTDNITIFQLKKDTTKLCIDIENEVKHIVTHFTLNICDLDIVQSIIPPVSFVNMVTILSSDFQKIIRDLNTFGEEVEIQFTKDELVFRCKGDFAEQETIINIDDGGEDAAQASEIVQGIFNLKNLILFTKCTSLCTHIKLHLRNDYPIIVEYNVAGLGEIKLALAPKTGGGKS